MKFRNLFNHRLMNEADEVISDGGGVDFGDDNADYSDDDSNESIEPSFDDAFKELNLDPRKYGIGEEKNESVEEKPQGSGEEKEAAGPATDEKSLLDRINSIGAIHSNLPVKVESVDELKNLIQMGKDYTLKTQSLSEERKAWESERVTAETELNGAIEEFNKQTQAMESQLQEMQQFQFALEQLKTNAPDVFEEVQRAYSEVGSRFKNPILDQQIAAMNKRLAEAESQLTAEKNKLVVDKFESEFSGLSAVEQSLKELGITVSKDEVKKHWAKTGMSVKEAMGALYFDHAVKAQASKGKVEAVKAKVAAKPTGAAGSSRPGTKVPAINRKKSYLEQAQELLKNMK